MIKKKYSLILFWVAYLVCSKSSFSQRLDHHNLYVSFGVSSVEKVGANISSSAYDLQFGYERLFTDQFRLGTSLDLGTTNDLVSSQTIITPQSTSISDIEERFGRVGVGITPIFNHTDRFFRLFFATRIGVSLVWKETRTILTPLSTTPGAPSLETSNSSTSGPKLYYNVQPLAGLAFPVGRTGSDSELSISVSYDVTRRMDGSSVDRLNYMGFELGYKYYFRRR